MSIRIVLHGYKGKMGKAIVNCVPLHEGVTIVGHIDVDNRGSLAEMLKSADAVVDFSSPDVTADLASRCADVMLPLVIGTTGHTDEQKKEVVHHTDMIPIVMASNFSTGVNALFGLTRKAAEILGPGFDLEIVETHHRLKKDAPSGTAKSLAEILKQVRDHQIGVGEFPRVKYGRRTDVGDVGRNPNEIGIHSIRGGDVVGDHTVIFAGNGERVELTHKASSRETFANGALRAAEWIIGKPPGLYDMMDVLGLK